GERVQVLYVGDGVETIGELEGGALVNALLRLFEGRDVEISCAAVGSSYDRAVLSGLAGATGGSFVRVEGAGNVHAAAGQITDAFYTPTLRRVRVEIEGLDATDVYPAEETSLAEGDTLIVLGEAGKSGRGRVTLRAEAGGRPFEKSWDIELEAARELNRFLPRLWAKAHIDALLAGMGLYGAAEDARRRERVIDTSVYYQIMSPFTAFLVLESEQDYARFGIKRQKREWDWHGDQNGVGSVTTGPASSGDMNEGNYFSPDPKPSAEMPPLPGSPAPEPVIVGQKKMLRPRWGDSQYTDWDGYGKLSMREEDLRFSKDLGDFERMLERKKRSKETADGKLKYYRFDAMYESGKSRFSRRGSFGPRYNLYEHVSPILSSGAVVGLKIDRPLKSSAVYRRKVKDGDASLSLKLNLALALGREGRVKEAIAELEKVIAALPELPDLRLELGALRHRGGDVKGAHEAFEKALKLTPENERPNVRARIQNFYTSTGNYQGLAEWTEAQAAAEKKPESAAGLLAQAASYWSNAGRADRARALWRRVSAAYEKLGRESADPARAAGWYSSAASYMSNSGDQRGARELWRRAAGCHQKLAAKAGEEGVKAGHLYTAAGWLRNAGETERAKPLSAESAGIFEKLAVRGKKVEGALAWVRQAAEAWRMAGRPEAAISAWEAALKRFPESGQLLQAAGGWFMNYGIDNSRAADLLLRAREKGVDSGDQIFHALVRAGRRKEAVAEIRRGLKTAKDANAVHQQLWKLHHLGA
ncbi:MAG: tetratricopeptide repeat protein, partial [Planctomycetota bacterium]